jgi:uroporphyrinogen III methyltransferase/synthase
MRRPAVYLIGAGPGDPGLMTVHGMECLRAADAVVYDHLVPQQSPRHARADAELIDVGKASPQPMAQDAICYLLAEKVRDGKVVARLKWGDPFVFDRGGEEAFFLHEQGVPFEVVPGIPAAVAVPAYAGVPVAYPGGGDTITLVRGHEDESRTLPAVDWASLARLNGTVICYAGAHQLPLLLEALRSNGWPADGQAVIVYNGTLPHQETVSGTIAELLDGLRAQPRHAPATLVVGRVVGLRPHLRWFDSRPLFGRRVLVTRPRDQAVELVGRLTLLGADAIEAPFIRIEPPEDLGPLQEAAAAPDAFDWIVFASTNAVDAFMKALLDGDGDVRSMKGPRLCAVGPGTAARLARYGIKVDLLPGEFRSEALVAAITAAGPVSGARVLLPRANIGRDVVSDQLRRAGAVVTYVVAYRTILNDTPGADDPDVYKLLLEGRIDVVTFASPSSARSFVALYGADAAADLLEHTVVAVMGPATADATRQLGLPVTIQPATYTISALVDAIAAHFTRET